MKTESSSPHFFNRENIAVSGMTWLVLGFFIAICMESNDPWKDIPVYSIPISFILNYVLYFVDKINLNNFQNSQSIANALESLATAQKQPSSRLFHSPEWKIALAERRLDQIIDALKNDTWDKRKQDHSNRSFSVLQEALAIIDDNWYGLPLWCSEELDVLFFAHKMNAWLPQETSASVPSSIKRAKQNIKKEEIQSLLEQMLDDIRKIKLLRQ